MQPDTEAHLPASPSRRKFLAVALVGAAAAVSGPVLAGPALANPPMIPPCDPDCPPRVTIRRIGSITLGAMIRAFASAPLGVPGSTQWALTETRTETFRLSSTRNRNFTFSANANLPSFRVGPVQIANTPSFKQARSSKVTNATALTIVKEFSERTSTRAQNPDGVNTADDTVFYLLARPVFEIFGLFENGVLVDDQFQYQLSYAGDVTPVTVRQLRTDPGLRNYIRPLTADSILATYPLLEDPSAEVLGLGLPRFQRVDRILPGAEYGQTYSLTGTANVSQTITNTVSTEITNKVGFSIPNPDPTKPPTQIGGFEVGFTFGTESQSVQEIADSIKLTVTINLAAGRTHIVHVYEDRALNTFLLSDEGVLLPFAPLAVQGTVTGADGRPVAGAVVALHVDDAPYVIVTDRAGRYAIRTPKPIKAGTYRLTCAGASRTVRIGAQPGRADFHRVDAAKARIRGR